MSDKKVVVKKSSGDFEPFSTQKLKKSLQISGVTNEEIDTIVEYIKLQLYDGISSKEIHEKAFFLLKKSNRICASKYSLKRAIFDLGPTGYPFERLISALLRHKGYKTKVGVILQGECVAHEIDVLAEKDENTYAIECKFHSNPNYACNVKIPLYINSRFIDVQKQWNKNSEKTTYLKQGWLVTNTRFTEDAINYAKCVGLTLFSWDYPKDNGISKNIDEFGLYPITVLTTLTKLEKKQLIDKNIILIKELLETPDTLKQLEISPVRIERIVTEVQKLCSM
ncbi:MAG: restriction endonuclease [Flavobacteriaceae bacterium]|nr:restriction endonuclease [Flavobacteriaceae bacterium]